MVPGQGLAATLSYGFVALWGRRHLADVPPLKSATCQLLSSTLIMTVVVAIVDRPWTLPMPSTEVWMALCGLALFGTAIAYVVFFEVLTRAGASNVMLVTLLIPVTALLLGNMFLAEPIPCTRSLVRRQSAWGCCLSTAGCPAGRCVSFPSDWPSLEGANSPTSRADGTFTFHHGLAEQLPEPGPAYAGGRSRCT